ncbi:RNA polymerase subunit sigma-70 [Phocaeicola plebeius]|uniref:RNA polymerase subunit sigma-70 n=1 Tax=Phocaeicola plebeius TaxID=310297 RepID=A0A414WR68_9BACT|nr:sigma-70 family RNA polymerase sigma factor [Phocaeicola plebeius]RHH39616.1 RNA polymerase subunit sigma-70 [Phocaeicola plebeius]
MKDTPIHIADQFFTDIYVTYKPLIYRYIFRKLNGCGETEDLVQDTFLRLLEYRFMLRPETVRSFVYTIVRNLVTDYIRRYYRKQEVMICIQEKACFSEVDMESMVVAKDLSHLEKMRVSQLPFKVRRVYSMSRFEEKTVLEIAEELGIPKRTVEGYLFVGRKSIRGYMKQCI